jgi:FkbM family methyltransferase
VADAERIVMRVRLPNNLTVHALNRAEPRVLYHDIFVNRTYLKHGIELNERDLVFDVGANIGLFALLLSQTLREFTLYAFEPVPQIFAMLVRNTSRFADRIKPLNVGLSDRAGRVPFTYYPHLACCSTYRPDRSGSCRAALRQYLDGALGGSAAPRDRTAWGRVSELPRSLLARGLAAYSLSGRDVACGVETASSMIHAHQISRIDLMKIDVEGSEWDVLRGVEEADWAIVRQVVMEVHGFEDGARSEGIRTWLGDRGFAVTADSEGCGAGVCMLYARRR